MYAPLSSRTTEKDFYRELRTQISALVELFVPTVTIVAGDFNAHLFRPTKDYDREFVALAQYWESESFSRWPTSERPFSFVSGKSSTTIDYSFFRGVRVTACAVAPLFIAQHRPIMAQLEFPADISFSQEKALGTAYWRSKAKKEALTVTLQGLDSVVHHGTPFLLYLSDDDRQQLNELRDVVSDLLVAADVDSSKQQQAKEKKKQLELLTTKLMTAALHAQTEKLAKTATSHTEAWQVLSKMRDAAPQCPIPTAKLVEHFSEVSKPQNSALLPKPLETSTSTNMHMDPIEPAEVEAALRDVNQAAAAGPDGISPKLMCNAFFCGVPFEFLFNLVVMCIVLAYVPLQWREATMFVLYKGSGDPSDPNSYRAISLTSAFGKLLERILLRRLLTWMRSSKLWDLPQFGFRRGCSCIHAIFLLRTLVLNILSDSKGPVFLSFVDLKKAFPSLGRDALFSRMLALGIPYPLVSAIRAFYIANVARLRVDDTLTRDFFVAVGVLEGSVLSPCLFGILFSVVWDLTRTSSFPTPDMRIVSKDGLWLIAYADDLVVITLSAKKLEETLVTLAKELKALNLQMRFASVPFTVCHSESTCFAYV